MDTKPNDIPAAYTEKIVLSKDGVKHGRFLGRFHFDTIEFDPATSHITLDCETGVMNKTNTPALPLYYTCPDICVFKARERRPCAWFNMPANVFFQEFQPWLTRVRGSPLAHEYDEIESEDFQDDDNISTATIDQPVGEVEFLELSQPAYKLGNVRGKFPFTRMAYRKSTGKVSLQCEITEENERNTRYEPEFYTSHEPVSVYSDRPGVSAWFTLPAEPFFDEFQPWWKSHTGDYLPEKAEFETLEADRQTPLAKEQASADTKAKMLADGVSYVTGSESRAGGDAASCATSAPNAIPTTPTPTTAST